MVNLNKESMFLAMKSRMRVANTFLRIWIKADPKKASKDGIQKENI